MTWPTIDHSSLSPSGRVSKRSRALAIERARYELFGDGLPMPTCPQPTGAERLLRQAAELRALAARGMKPRAYMREAARLEVKAKGEQL